MTTTNKPATTVNAEGLTVSAVDAAYVPTDIAPPTLVARPFAADPTIVRDEQLLADKKVANDARKQAHEDEAAAVAKAAPDAKPATVVPVRTTDVR